MRAKAASLADNDDPDWRPPEPQIGNQSTTTCTTPRTGGSSSSGIRRRAALTVETGSSSLQVLKGHDEK